MSNNEMFNVINNESNETKSGFKRAVLYIRYSTNNQHDESAEAQIRACEEYAKKNNIQIIYIYKDLGISGTSTKGRTSFNQMIKDSSKGLFDLVLVHKIDRFARSTEDFFTNEKKLNKNNVEVIAVDSPFDNSPMGKMIKTMMVGMAEMFSSNLSSEVAYKNREYARKGHFLGSFAPLGYDNVMTKDDTGREYKTVKINESEAKIIHLVYTMYVNRYSGKAIANKLYELGYKTKQGNAFTRKTITDIIDNEIYKGTYVFSKNSKHNLEPIRIENNHEAIIDEELWNKAQALRSSYKNSTNSRNKSQNKYLLTGILFCKQCGYAFTGCGGNKTTRYYGCASCRQKHKGFCFNSKYVNKDIIESRVFDLIYTQLFTEELINSYTKLIIESLNKKNNDETRLKELEQERKKLARKIDLIMDLYLDGEIDKLQLKEKQSKIQEDLEVIEKRLFELQVSMQPIDEKIIKAYLLNIKKNLHKLNGDEKESFIKNIIDRIEIDMYDINIYFKVFSPYQDDGGNNLSQLLYKNTTGLGVVTLYNKEIPIIKLENGTYIGCTTILK